MTKIHNIIVHHEIWRYDGLFSDWKSRFFFLFFYRETQGFDREFQPIFYNDYRMVSRYACIHGRIQVGAQDSKPNQHHGTWESHDGLERPTNSSNPPQTWETHNPQPTLDLREPWLTNRDGAMIHKEDEKNN